MYQIRYRLSDGKIIEYNSGPVTLPSGGEAVVLSGVQPRTRFEFGRVLMLDRIANGVLVAREQGDVDAERAIYAVGDETKLGRLVSDQADWLTSILARKTPAEVRTLITDRIKVANNVAQLRQVLLDLLPVIGA